MLVTPHITVYPNERANQGLCQPTSWNLLVEKLSTIPEVPCDPCPGKTCRSKFGLAWSPVRIEGTRANRNVKAVTVGVFDLDDVSDGQVAQLVQRLEGQDYLIHSTHSHLYTGAGHNFLRLVMPLSREATPEEWPKVLAMAIEQWEIPADPACKDLSRIYFLPSRPRGVPALIENARTRLVLSPDGQLTTAPGERRPLDVDAMMMRWASSPRSVAPSPVPFAWASHQDDGLFDDDGGDDAEHPLERQPAALDDDEEDELTVGDLRKMVGKTKRKKARSAKPEDVQRYQVLCAVMDGAPLALTGGRSTAVNRVVSIISHCIPLDTAWDLVRELIRPAVAAMPCEPSNPCRQGCVGDCVDHWLKVAEESYNRAMPRAAEHAREREERKKANAFAQDALLGLTPSVRINTPLTGLLASASAVVEGQLPVMGTVGANATGANATGANASDAPAMEASLLAYCMPAPGAPAPGAPSPDVPGAGAPGAGVSPLSTAPSIGASLNNMALVLYTPPSGAPPSGAPSDRASGARPNGAPDDPDDPQANKPYVPPPKPKTFLQTLTETILAKNDGTVVNDWTDLLRRTADGKLQASRDNIYLLLKCHSTHKGTIRWNEVRRDIEVTGGPFYGYNHDVYAIHLTTWMSRVANMNVKQEDVERQILAVAMEDAYDPIKDYMESLVWDGIPRLNDFFFNIVKVRTTNQAGEDISDHLRRIGPMIWISSVARTYTPGCQVDTMWVMEGLEGEGKTSFLRRMFGDYFITMRMGTDSKDAQMIPGENWCAEVAELHAVKRSDDAAVLSYLSETHDKYRPPYGRRFVTVPRRNISIATTNEKKWLTPGKGRRRYWPTWVLSIDLDAIALVGRDGKVMPGTGVRDQLWAEAVHRFKAGERWWLTKEERAAADEEAEARVETSYFQEKIASWYYGHRVDKRQELIPTLVQITEDVLKIATERMSSQLITRVDLAMQNLGFDKQLQDTGGLKMNVYMPSREMRGLPARPSYLQPVPKPNPPTTPEEATDAILNAKVSSKGGTDES